MEIKKMICAGAILLSFMACSQDDVMTDPQGGNASGEGAYMSLAISMPNGTPGTRAIDEGTDKEEGTIAEQTISKLLVLVYKSDAQATDAPEVAKEFLGTQLTPTKPNDPANSDKTTVYEVPAFEVSKGEKKVVVIANPSSSFSGTSTLQSMRTAITMTEEDVNNISSSYSEGGATGFLMTNANFDVNQNQSGAVITITPTENGKFYDDGSVYVKVEGTKTNPTSVRIAVERVVAKILDETSDYTKTVTGTSDKVVFQTVALINGNKQFFPIKNIRQSSESTTGTNDYVVDPNFDNNEKTMTFADHFYAYDWSTPGFESRFKTLSTTDTERPVFYTLENTMIQNQQMNAYTTGLYYQATYYKDGETSGEAPNLYKYAGVLYTFSELQTAASSLSLNLGSLTDESAAAEFKKILVTKYENGVCYYPYWIRHVDNGDPTSMGIMEFAVVRNNVYKMTINSVKGIGTPDPKDPDPDTPDEMTDAMLQVQVKVLPWTIRNNQIDF